MTLIIYHVFFTGIISKVGRKVNIMSVGGYVISRLALKRFVEEAIPNCSPFAESAKKDRYVSECFTNYYQWIEPFPNETGACPIGTQLQGFFGRIR